MSGDFVTASSLPKQASAALTECWCKRHMDLVSMRAIPFDRGTSCGAAARFA
jgi:hypothetical protein